MSAASRAFASNSSGVVNPNVWFTGLTRLMAPGAAALAAHRARKSSRNGGASSTRMTRTLNMSVRSMGASSFRKLIARRKPPSRVVTTTFQSSTAVSSLRFDERNTPNGRP
jgi:hypothetical protein